MINSKLIKVIRALDASERNRLHLFLRSPYFVNAIQEDKLLSLYEYILQTAPTFETEPLAKATVFKALFPEETPIKGKLEKLMTALLKFIQKFIIHEHHRMDSSIKQQLILARFFQQKGLEQYFTNSLKKARSSQVKTNVKDKQHYHLAFEIEQTFTHYQSYYNSRVDHLNIVNALQKLDAYHVVSKLEYYCMLLAQTGNDSSLQALIPQTDIRQLEQNILQQDLLQHPLIKVYYTALQLLKEEEEEKFHLLNQLLQEHKEVLPEDGLKSFAAICRNYCVRRCNNGQTAFFSILHQLYLDHLQNGYLYYEGGLLASTYRNIVTSGLRLKAYDWVETFIHSYKNRIKGSRDPEATYQFNLANYYFAIQRYEEALTQLPDKHEDLYYKLASKRLELKIYYELKSPLLESRIDAFKVYIFRLSKKQLPDLLRRANNHFIDLFRQILMPKTYRNPERINKLQLKVQEKKVIAEKEWLLTTIMRLH